MDDTIIEESGADIDFIEFNDVYKERRDLTRAIQVKLGKRSYSVGNSNSRAHVFLCKSKNCILYKFSKSRKDLNKNFLLIATGTCICDGQPLVNPQNLKRYNVKKKSSITMKTQVPTIATDLTATTSVQTSATTTTTTTTANTTSDSNNNTSTIVSSAAAAAAVKSRESIYAEVMKFNQERQEEKEKEKNSTTINSNSSSSNSSKPAKKVKKLKNGCLKCLGKSADQGCVECQALTICKQCSIDWIAQQRNEGIIEPRTCPQCNKTFPLYDLQKPQKKSRSENIVNSENAPVMHTSTAVPVATATAVSSRPVVDTLVPIAGLPITNMNNGTTIATVETTYVESLQSTLTLQPPRHHHSSSEQQQQRQKRSLSKSSI